MTRSDSTLRHRLAGQTMGTEWSLQWCAPPSLSEADVRATLEEVFARVINQMSTWEPESEISRFNLLPCGSTMKIGSDFQNVLKQAVDIARQSAGAFDPTLGALISRRGFGSGLPPKDDNAVPFGPEVWANLMSQNGTIKQSGGVRLDLSAIAKGYALDEMTSALREKGIAQSLVEIGGEFRGSGVKPDGLPWWVDLEKEHLETSLGQPLVRIALYNMSLATSGGFRQCVRTKEGPVSHIVPFGSVKGTEINDPNLSSVSVLHDDCMTADGWATALFALGLKEGFALSEELGLKAIFQQVEGEVLFSTAAQSLRL